MIRQIFLTRVFPSVLTVLVLGILFWWPEDVGAWFWWIAGVLFVLDGVIWIGLRLRKAPNLRITEDAVIVGGLRLSRCDIRAWGIFRSSSDGERRRYMEIQLTRIPASPFVWWLVKRFEQVPVSGRWDRGVALAREPRIIVTLSGHDLTKEEIHRALDCESSVPAEVP